MRKVKLLGIAFLFSSCLFLAGCAGEKVLTCSIAQKQDGLSMEQTVAITFKGESVSNIKLTVNSKATNDLMKDNWNLLIDTFDSQFPDSNKEGIELAKENKKDDYTYIITLNIDPTKAKEKDLAEYDLDGVANAKGTYETVKESAEKSGFTCE